VRIGTGAGNVGMPMNGIIKIVGVIAVVGAVAAATSLSVHRHLVWERVGGDQLVWSSDEALHFATSHREGWSGNLLELGWEYVRAYFHQSGTLTDRKTSLVVTQITNNGTTQTVLPDTETFPLGVF
jgi:hypothetical protein